MPFETDNITTQGILTSNMHAKLLKAFNMRYWWVKDRIEQKMFDLIWATGKKNAAYYFTKHHPPWHNTRMRRVYIQQVVYHVTLLTYQYSKYANRMRGCVTLVTLARTARTSLPCQK